MKTAFLLLAWLVMFVPMSVSAQEPVDECTLEDARSVEPTPCFAEKNAIGFCEEEGPNACSPEVDAQGEIITDENGEPVLDCDGAPACLTQSCGDAEKGESCEIFGTDEPGVCRAACALCSKTNCEPVDTGGGCSSVEGRFDLGPLAFFLLAVIRLRRN